MKIELTDKNHWLQQIDERLQRIETERKASDELFVKLWRKRKWLPNRKPTEFPEYGEDMFTWETGYLEYPCQDYWMTEQRLKRIQQAILTDHTGTIYVDSEELEALRWSNV